MDVGILGAFAAFGGAGEGGFFLEGVDELGFSLDAFELIFEEVGRWGCDGDGGVCYVGLFCCAIEIFCDRFTVINCNGE